MSAGSARQIRTARHSGYRGEGGGFGPQMPDVSLCTARTGDDVSVPLSMEGDRDRPLLTAAHSTRL